MPFDPSASVYVLSHPTRQRIVRFLQDGNGQSIDAIASALDLSTELTGFHLLALEQHGLVEVDMVFANPDTRMEARFKSTAKVKEAVEAIAALVG